MLTLLPGEEIISQANNQEVTLTTHRIMKNTSEWGKSYNQSIMLEHITSCENNGSSNVTVFWVGIILLIGGFMLLNRGGIVGILGAIICAIIYKISKKNEIIISSPSTRMTIPVEGMDTDNVMKFINRIEQTKNERIVSLSNRPNIIG